MEQVLPRDMVNEILGHLSDQDLFNYRLTSKTCLNSSEHIWKKRYESLEGADPSDHPSSSYWYCNYLSKSKDIFINKLNEDMKVFSTLDRSFEKKLLLDKMCGFIYSNLHILSRKRLQSLNTTLKNKLRGFIQSHSQMENEIGHKYYPLFFPEQYNDYLVMKYLYEDNEPREDPDYV